MIRHPGMMLIVEIPPSPHSPLLLGSHRQKDTSHLHIPQLSLLVNHQ